MEKGAGRRIVGQSGLFRGLCAVGVVFVVLAAVAVVLWVRQGGGASAWMKAGAVVAAALAGCCALGAADVWTPRRIPWNPVTTNGQAAHRADDLIIQHQFGRQIWATRGCAAYVSDGDGPFVRAFHVPMPFGIGWMGHSRLLRFATKRTDWIEVLPLAADRLLVFGGGRIWKVTLGDGRVREVFRGLRFGLKLGLGVLRTGFDVDAQGRIFLGEWFRYDNSLGLASRIFSSADEGETWSVVCELSPDLAQHIHAVQYDPYGDAIWVTTGDGDATSRIGCSVDGCRTITWVAGGSEDFRTTQLLFWPDRVVWGMDAPGVETCWIYEWLRESGEVRKVVPLPAVAFYTQRLYAQSDLGLMGLGYKRVACWMGGPNSPWREVVKWDIAMRRRPVLRFARGENESEWVYLGLHMTVLGHDVIVRAPLSVFSEEA